MRLDKEDFERAGGACYTLLDTVFKVLTDLIFPLSSVDKRLKSLEDHQDHIETMNQYALERIDKLGGEADKSFRFMDKRLNEVDTRISKIDPKQKLSSQSEAMESIVSEIVKLRGQVMANNSKFEDLLEKLKLDNSFRGGPK